MLVHAWQIMVVALAGWLNQQQQDVVEYLREENRVLREQLKGKRLRFTDDQRRRLAAKGKTLGSKVLREICTLVTPETILRWYRTLIAKKYDSSGKRGPGRPPTKESIQNFVVRMAKENISWGYGRIQGALKNLGHVVSRSTIARILKAHGIEPAPRRHKGMSWATFLKSHWEVLAATDLFTVEVMTLGGLVRHHVLFVIEQCTRRVEIAGIVPEPDGERNHQGLGNELIAGAESVGQTEGEIVCHERLGGLLRYYHRAA